MAMRIKMKQIIQYINSLYPLSLGGIVLLGTTLIANSAAAQDIRFEHYTSENGLPSNALYVVSESDDGYLWIGSKVGLIRFDGLNFQSLLHGRDDDLALPGRSVQYLINDSENRLWLGVEGAGLVQVDHDMNIVQQIDHTTSPMRLPTDTTIWSMAEGCKGYIWVGFAGGGIVRIHPEKQTIESLPVHIPDSQSDSRVIPSIHVDRNCQVWAGLWKRGLVLLNRNTHRFEIINSDDWDIDNQTIITIASNKDLVYAATSSEIGIFDSITGDYVNKIDLSTPSDGVERAGIRSLSIHEDTLWAATNNGLYSIQLNVEPKPTDAAELDQMLAQGSFSSDYYIKRYSRKDTISDSLASDTQLFVATGKNGNVWVATHDNGLVYKPPGWDAFSLLRRDRLAESYLPSNNIKAALVDDMHLWIGTYNDGLARYSYLDNQIDTPDELVPLPFRRVWAIHTDDKNETWVAGADLSQFVKYKPGQALEELSLPQEYLIMLSGIRPLGFAALNDSMWIITKYNYLVRYDLQTFEWHLRQAHDPNESSTFTDYIVINDRQFLASTETNLYHYDADTDDFTVLLDASQDNIQQMALDQNNHLWLAQKNGLAQYRLNNQNSDQPLEQLLQLRYSASLRNTVINNMVFDSQGQLWLGSLNGLFKMLPTVDTTQGNTQPPFLRLTRSDGLPSSEMSENTLMLLNDNRLSIGTNQGVVLFDPRKIRPQAGRPKVDINSLSTLEQTYDSQMLNEPLVFNHDNNSISLRFNAVIFNNRDALGYQYQLDGWDQDWIDTRQVPQITYSRLNHGNYTFKARARIGFNDWGDINDSVSFTIKRPPWVTWWAYALYTAMAVLLLWSLYQRRVRASARRRTLYQAHERQKFAETQTRIATDFASAIHYEEIADTLSTTLKSGMSMVRMLVHFPDETDPTHEYIYNQQKAEQIPASVDFESLCTEFNNNPKMRHHQQEIATNGADNAIQLSLPLGAKRPVQAVVCLHFPPDTPPAENDIALASLVAQTAESAVDNTLLLERVSLLAELNQRANDAKSEFISTVSHEIRTPLHGLMGMLDLLNKCDSDQQRILVLNRLTESSQQLLSVVDDVLDISKIEANKVELSQDTFDLYEVIDHVRQLFLDQASSKQLYLHGLVAPAVSGWWLGDKTRLIQILTNLINNAIKFTSSGGLCITAYQSDAPGSTGLLLTVADTGLGMSSEVIDKLFDKYQQAEDWTWKKYGGSGLGLSITHRLVELMDGRIEVTSKVDQGSHFKIYLPLEKPDILKDIQALQWPHQLVIHLACGDANNILEPLFSNGNQVIKHAYESSSALSDLNGQCEILITNSLPIAQQCQLNCALLSDAKQSPTPASDNVLVFNLSHDWDALLVWILDKANDCR